MKGNEYLGEIFRQDWGTSLMGACRNSPWQTCFSFQKSNSFFLALPLVTFEAGVPGCFVWTWTSLLSSSNTNTLHFFSSTFILTMFPLFSPQYIYFYLFMYFIQSFWIPWFTFCFLCHQLLCATISWEFGLVHLDHYRK